MGIDEPFVGAYGANLNFFTLAAKNFSRFGYFRLHFLPTYYSGGDLGKIPDFYLHHPVFYYTLVSLPFKVFGFHNWVASVTPILFSLLTLYWLFKIGSFLWNRKTGLWVAVFGSFTPIMTVFGRQTIFEPAILALLLGVYYYFLVYLKYKKVKDVLFLTILSFLAILIDWGGAYFIFPFLLLYWLLPKGKEKKLAVLLYFVSTLLGLSLFILIVFLVRGNFGDLLGAISSRQTNPELFNLPYPWFKLILVSLLRIVIYLTPLSLLALFIFLKDLVKAVKLKKINPQMVTFLFFLIFGLLNLIFLPAATFGHIYFLLYLVPFFALTLGKYFADLSVKKSLFSVVLIVVIYLFSSLVTYAKWQQIEKQVWRYDAALKINRQLAPYEAIAVKGFPGDIFEQYFFHPTKPIEDYSELLNWLSQAKSGERKTVFSCWDTCSEEDYQFIENIPYKTTKFAKVWLIENTEIEKPTTLPEIHQIEKPAKTIESSLLIRFYRLLRDKLQVGQL